MGLTERHLFEYEDVPENYEWELEDAVYNSRINKKRDIVCPICGKKIFKRTDIALTSYPAQYQYECECGWVGYAYV